jgi:hypothetical protein
MRPIQYFSDEYLERCRGITPDQVILFLDDFRRLHGGSPSQSKLISIKIPEDLLAAFKHKARLADTRYQTQIKKLMKDWVLEG